MNYIWKLTDLDNIPKNGYKVFSCFACGGGSSMGYKLAGYEVIGCNEIDPKINAMYVKNFPPRYNYCSPIQEFKQLKEYPEELLNLDILDGSPPCSTFSMMGQREKNWGKMKKFKEGQAKQILSDLFFDYIELAGRLRPKIIVSENVKGMLLGNAKGYLNEIIKRFDEIGYRTQLFLLNGATMGVPQRRERVFFISVRKDLNLPKIKLSFNERPILYKEFKDSNYTPMNRDSLTYKLWLMRKPSDKKLSEIRKRVDGKETSFGAIFLHDNETPPTIVASGSYPMRMDVPGYVSKKDIITISSFPQDYDFNGADVKYVCGMSVPPLMMYKVSEQIKIQLLDNIIK